ncbi:MAG: TROVE domain-containing protein [Chloroflexota bacterium]
MRYIRAIIGDTTQREPLPGQVPNSAGGYSYPVDDWIRLRRFLVLGSEGGSYYASERALTLENAGAVARCIAADGARAVAEIVAVSVAGRAPKNDPALFALALAANAEDRDTRAAALAALPQVARTGTHVLHFAGYVQALRGWGRGLRRAVASWFLEQPVERLVLQAIKYRQRDGWALRDLLRLSHARTDDETRNAALYWIVKGWPGVGAEPHPDPVLRQIWAVEMLQRAETPAAAARLIAEYRLPREAVPTQRLGSPEVWEALLAHMPLEAMVRNLATMTRVGLLAPLSAAAATVAERLRDGEAIRRARLHPVKVLAALLTYAAGRGQRSDATWTPVPAVVDALNDAFELAFGAVEPAGTRHLLALDVSGSMAMGTIAGVPGLTPRVGAAAMSLITARVEPEVHTLAFSHTLVPLAISPRQRLDDVVKATSNLPFGRTDCALPMLWALSQRVAVDTFVVYTDSETWYGSVHPAEALRRYREGMGIAAKLIVVGMVANSFSIADPEDGGMLDVVGFDTAAPQVMRDFSAAGG